MIIAGMTVAGFYVVMCAFVYAYQENLIFYPCRDRAVVPGWLPVESVTFPSGNETLHGWYLRAVGDGPRVTVVFFHGNGGCVAGQANRLEAIRSLGMDGFVFDYRGYGESTGKITSEAGLYDDAEAAIRFLNTRGVRVEDIVLWGQSMGGAVASEMATRYASHALILDSTFFSMEEMAARQYPYLPTGLLLKYRFRNGAKVGNIRTPTLVIHSREDGTVPFDNGERLYNAAAGPRMFVETKSSHASALYDDPDTYLGGIRAFLEKAAGKRISPS